MQEEYLEMRDKELLIDGIAIAEVTNLEDAMAISDRVSNYVAELQREITKLRKEVNQMDKMIHGTMSGSLNNWKPPYMIDKE